MPVPAFTYAARRDSQPPSVAIPGAAITLNERVEYVLHFQSVPSRADQQRVIDFGGEFLRVDLAVLSFANFVGETSLAGVGIEVVSSKIGSDGVSRILDEVSRLSAGLVFGWRSSTGFRSVADPAQPSTVPYHQLQLLRRTILRERSGQRLQDWLRIIEGNPTRRFEPERALVPVTHVRRLDRRAIQSVVSRLKRLVPLPQGVEVATSPLAHKLTFGVPQQRHFPVRVDAPRGRLSFDTVENRFVRHALEQCLYIIYRFIDHPKLHAGLRDDCRTMLAVLGPVASAPFVAEASPLLRFQAPSQALAKANGYRELFQFWNHLTRHVSLPRGNAETARLLEGRDMATLYEYWVFVKILLSTVSITGCEPSKPATIRRDELGESLSLKFMLQIGPDLVIAFNRTFRRSAATAYSTPLRPDVTLQVGETRYVFDAKYRLERFDAGEHDADDVGTYKRADLYKMHTYRDAISHVQGAFIVYPGTEFVFFERGGALRRRPADVERLDGVGAVPLRPVDETPEVTLHTLLYKLIRPSSVSS